ncbi:disaggregatase related repeat-containing protein, partial [Methanomethylovorans sp.]|uniref:disaggregatase related repeat-containing protein n=1 Tax=Methanomethylovorans sp. TaxID=2758717 RepID=UPI003D13A65E
NAAIEIQNFDNTIIENNVFDDGGHAAIKWYVWSGHITQQKAQFTTYVRNNIIMNSDGASGVTGSGVGIWNTQPSYAKFIVQNNNIYNNKNGQTYGSGFTMSNNLNVDPQCVDPTNSKLSSRDYHLKSKAGRYSSGKWVTDSISSPLIDEGNSKCICSSEPSPNGGVINIGRYGNTAEASKSGSSASTADNAPVANAGADKTATAGSSVSFDGSASTDDKGIASYSWDFDASNGITAEATTKTVTKTYTAAGTYTVTLTVTDTSGQKSTDTVDVVVSTAVSNQIDDPLTVYDNRLRDANPTTVYSDSNYIDLGMSSTRCRDLMWFDLSDYKTTDTISKATLSLYWYYPTGATRTSDTVVEVYRPAAEWDPKYVTWNNRVSGTAWSTAGGSWYDKNGVAQGSTPYASLTFPARTVPGNKYYDFDVTQLVQEYVSGKNKNTGLFLKARTESGNYIAFYSSEWTNAAQRPILTVTVGTPAADNAPVANAGADKTATAGSSVSFDGSASTDDKGIASYSWDFDVSNGITDEATAKTVTKTYTAAGTYTVTLTVTDTSGQKSTDTVDVVVSTAVSNQIDDPLTVYDNRLRDANPTTVYSDSNYIDLGMSSTRCRDLMWFDLSDYKTTDTISKATLSLYWYYPTGATRTSDTVVEVYRPAAEWDPKYVTWNNRVSGTAWSTAGGSWYDKNGVAQGSTPYASLTFPARTVPGNKYYDFDVTQLVQEYVSGKNKNTGLFLKARTESGNYIAFYSSEWTNAAQRPILTVTVGTPAADNAPVANAGADKTATAGSSVSFDGSASTDDKGIASYSWDFDVSNGITDEATAKTVTKTYTAAGTYTVTLTVTDTSGQKSTDTVKVVVSSTPVTNTGFDLYDNRLVESSKTTVYGSSNYLDIGRSSTRCRDLMWFDLSDYKTTDTISKATLSLYWYYPTGATRTSDTVVEVYRPAAEWDPKYVTWNNRVSGTAWSTAGGSWYDKNGVAQGSTPYASLTFPARTVPGNKYYEFDVTQLVQEYVSGKNKNTGLFLKARTESGNYIAFYSSEWTNAAQKPKLTVTATKT